MATVPRNISLAFLRQDGKLIAAKGEIVKWPKQKILMGTRPSYSPTAYAAYLADRVDMYGKPKKLKPL